MSGRRSLHIVSLLFLLAFCASLGVDWYVWTHTLNSAPFSLRVLERCLTLLLPGCIVFLAARACGRPRGRTACTVMLALLAAAALGLALANFLQTPGAVRTDVLLRDYAVAENGRSVTLEMDLASSAGYLQSVDIREEGTALYLTFHGTRGVNSAARARMRYELSLPEGCSGLYIWGQGGEYHPALQRDGDGQWRRPS